MCFSFLVYAPVASDTAVCEVDVHVKGHYCISMNVNAVKQTGNLAPEKAITGCCLRFAHGVLLQREQA